MCDSMRSVNPTKGLTRVTKSEIMWCELVEMKRTFPVSAEDHEGITGGCGGGGGSSGRVWKDGNCSYPSMLGRGKSQ